MTSSSDSFFLQCPSNASMHIFPNNTLAEYTNHLETALEIEKDEWEVGLCEIQYPQAWDNVRRGSNKFTIAYQSPRPAGKWTTIEKEVPPGYYKTIPELLHVIKSIYGSTDKKNQTLEGLEMKFNSTTRRVTINADQLRILFQMSDGRIRKPKALDAYIILNGDIARLLGFNDKTFVEKGKTIRSEFPATVSGGFHQMYVYSDIIEPQPHPDGNVQILRTIPIVGKPNNDYLSKRFQNVYYMPVSKQSFSTIRFQILDDTGKKVGFDFGKVLIVLNFRRRMSRR